MGRFWKAAAASLALNLAISGIAVAAPLRDIASFWARPYIETLAERQFVEGFPDGTFRPDAPITRAQFAAMALKAFDLPGGGERPDFRDVDRNYWAASAIAAVSKSGLVAGFPDGTFHPEENITRAQALVILSRVLGTNRPDAAATLQRYADAQEVPEWARSAIATAADAGILVNYPDSTVIEPNSLATRGAVAALFYQTLARSGQSLPPLEIGTLAPNAPANPEDRTSQPS